MRPTIAWMLSGFILISSGAVINAVPVLQERFDRANQLYEEGNYSEALNIYLEIEKAYRHWKVFYNIGNCYYKLHRPVPAKIYYLRARRLEPFEPSIQKNIEIVNKLLKDKIPSPKPDFLSRMLMRIESLLSLDVLSIGLLVLIVIFNGFVFILIKKGKSRFILYGASFSLILAVLFAGYHIHRVNQYNRRNIAVIIKEDAQLRSGPGENQTVLFKVNPGLEVKIIDQSGNMKWVQVTASAEIAGWIEEKSLERI
ncbi:MAG: SH3 domain-containing protein [Candidatus Aminicenantes bacterium]|nr:MAG: SH3 domain-containing protein [Candidatus Aminicenantes bacterium]